MKDDTYTVSPKLELYTKIVKEIVGSGASPVVRFVFKSGLSVHGLLVGHHETAWAIQSEVVTETSVNALGIAEQGHSRIVGIHVFDITEVESFWVESNQRPNCLSPQEEELPS